MPISNFPTALQPIIDSGFLEREFQQALTSRLGYRAVADRMVIAAGVGETLTKTRVGLRPAVTTPLAVSTNTNLDNGLTPTGFSVEQYTISINHYASTTDLNMVTSRVGIANQFLQNAYANGEQAARSLDDLARNALFNAYFGGNTRVRVTLGAANVNVSVDDIRGFQQAPVNGVLTNIGAGNTLQCSINGNTYTLVGVASDGGNFSLTPGGQSGVLTFATAVSVADGTANNSIIAVNASSIQRPNGRSNYSALTASDTLTMSVLLNAVATLRMNAVPEIDGVFNCYLDPVSSRQLFADPDFRQLFSGATSANQVFQRGMINDFLGLRFIPVTEAYVQQHPLNSSLFVRRPIVVGAGALIEGDFAGMGADDTAPANSIVSLVDGVAMVTREPIDRLQQIISQSWYWMGGFTAPTDVTTNPGTVPTSTPALYKRAVMVEHIG